MRWLGAGALLCASTFAAAAASQAVTPVARALTAAEVIEKNIAARGGLEAWRKVETMAWMGHVESGAQGAARPMLFVLELKRPNMTRFEIQSQSDKFARIFDGAQGWKLRPGSAGTQDVRPLSPEEVKYAREEYVIDGPLVDYQAKGVAVTLEGLDDLEGRKAYRLTLKLPSGASRRLWIDAQTFLESRYDRPSASPHHPGAALSVYYRNYAAVDGLQIPMRIEHGSAPGLAVEKAQDSLVIDRVVVNPSLPERSFGKPSAPRQHRATVNITGEAPSPSPALGGPVR
jgi:hypothetical protein